MANPYRGEVGITLDGRPHVMRLTLGALCELEAGMGGSVAELVERFESGRFRAGDVLALLGAGLRGGGAAIADAELSTMLIDGGPVVAIRKAAELLRVSFALPAEAGDG